MITSLLFFQTLDLGGSKLPCDFGVKFFSYLILLLQMHQRTYFEYTPVYIKSLGHIVSNNIFLIWQLRILPIHGIVFATNRQ